MVNKIPFYGISAGGKIALLASRCHPATSQIMSVTARETLESCGVETDDIYLIDCPANTLLPGMSREIARSGSFAAVVALAVLPSEGAEAQAVRMGMSMSDFAVPVIPVLVPGGAGGAQWAAAAEKAARAAVELVNFSSMLAEFAAGGGTTEADEADGLEEFVETAAPARSRRTASRTTRRPNAASNGRKKAASNGRKKRQ